MIDASPVWTVKALKHYISSFGNEAISVYSKVISCDCVFIKSKVCSHKLGNAFGMLRHGPEQTQTCLLCENQMN